ncbi:MAG: class I SAM-dependent methyltransferase [Anaerolineales bacterium]|nr:class I SAM-dependent methyltransferase [Anaerolineales bacterium]
MSVPVSPVNGKPIPLRLRILAVPLRIFFRLLYHQMAWTYDWVAAAVSLGMWDEWVRAVLPYLHGTSILELGHGPGHLQVLLHKMGKQVFGLDRSPQMGHIAKKRLRKHGFPTVLTNGDARLLPFPDASFDQVVATFPSEYIIHPLTLAEIERVLKHGGSAVILPFAWITGKKPLQRLAGWLFRFTGESPEWSERALDPLRNAGYDARAEQIQLQASNLLAIIIQKH